MAAAGLDTSPAAATAPPGTSGGNPGQGAEPERESLGAKAVQKESAPVPLWRTYRSTAVKATSAPPLPSGTSAPTIPLLRRYRRILPRHLVFHIIGTRRTWQVCTRGHGGHRLHRRRSRGGTYRGTTRGAPFGTWTGSSGSSFPDVWGRAPAEANMANQNSALKDMCVVLVPVYKQFTALTADGTKETAHNQRRLWPRYL